LQSHKLSQQDYSEVLKLTKIRGKMAEDVSVVMHDPNKKNIALFLMVMSVAMLASQSGSYMNICTSLFEARYDWVT